MPEAASAIPADCRIRIEGLASRPLPDLNLPLRPFLDGGSGGVTPGMSVRIGPFSPDLKGTSNVDHRYFMRRDYLYFSESAGGLDFQAEIRGLETDRTEIRIHGTRRPFNPARWLYPDAALQSLVLLPLLERKLARHGLHLLHAGGIARAGKAVLLVGRGGSFKTTYCFRLAREGWSFLGDDLLLFDVGRVHPLPLHAAYFDFHLRKGLRNETEMGLGNKLRMARHLRSPGNPSFKLADASVPDRIVFLDPIVGKGDAELKPLSADAAALRARLDTRMERYADLPSKYVAGTFLDAYALIFPDTVLKDPHGMEWDRDFRALAAGSSLHVMETDARWRPGNLDVLKAHLG